MVIEIKLYEDKYFNKLCAVMDKARMQELESENLQDVFISLTKAPYQNYLLSCKIYIAVKNEELLGFKTIKTAIEKWSVEYPVEFSQDTMELR